MSEAEQPKKKKKSALPWYIALASLSMALGVFLALQFGGGPGSNKVEQFDGGAMLPPRALPDVSLTDYDKKPFTPERFKGKWTFLFFGYTYCPDICPTTLTLFSQVRAELEKAGALNDVAFVFQSVDPPRDTPERLKEYVTYFHPDFMGVTGSEEAISTFARSVGAVYMRVTGDGRDEQNYLVDHSSTVFLIGPDAALHAVFTAPHVPAKVAAGLQMIREKRE